MGVTPVKTITRGTVVLPSSTWRSELAAELVTLGFTEAQASTAALSALQNILSKAGWPSSVFGVAENPAAD
jgi:hypothetical protein